MAVTTGPFLNDIVLLSFVVDTTGDTTIEKMVRAGQTTIYAIFVDNSLLASPVYLKFYDDPNPTGGTTDPDDQFLIPASTRVPFFLGPDGMEYSSGLSFAVSDSPGTQAGSAPATPPTVRIVCT